MAHTENFPPVEIISLTHNQKDYIENCLISLRKCDYKNLKITVVDQNSSDGTGEYIKKSHKNVNLVVNSVNKGFSEGNNDILKKSNAKYCILLNDDTTHEPSWVTELVKIAEGDESVAAVQPKVLAMDNRKMFEYAGAAGGFIDIYGYPICRGRVFDSIEEDRGQYDDSREVFWSCGVAMLIRMDVLRKIGYLDEMLGSYAEELDLCWRMNLSGYKIKYAPKSIIFHKGSVSWKKNRERSLKKVYLIHRNHWIILFKNYSREMWWRIFPMKVILEGINLARFLLTKPAEGAAIVKANLWILTNLKNLIIENKKISKLKKISDEEIMKKMISKSTALNYFISGRKKFKDYVK